MYVREDEESSEFGGYHEKFFFYICPLIHLVPYLNRATVLLTELLSSLTNWCEFTPPIPTSNIKVLGHLPKVEC